MNLGKLKLSFKLLCGLFFIAKALPVAAEELPECELGALAYFERQYQAAADHVSRCLQEHELPLETLYEALMLRAQSYMLSAKPDRAIPDLNEGIELLPGKVEAYHLRGSAYSQKGQMERSIQDYDKAIELDPTYVHAYSNRGGAYSDLGDHERAITDLEQAVRLNPSDGGNFHNRGIVYAALGMPDRAYRDFEEAIRLNPRDHKAFTRRAITQLAKANPDLESALQDFSKALEINPNYALAYQYRGNSHFISGNYDRAISDLKKALGYQHDSHEVILQLYLARAHAGLLGARADLRSDSDRLSLSKWPGPVIEMFIGNRSPESVLQMASSVTRYDDKIRYSLANYYVGQHYLLSGAEGEARQYFQRTLDTEIFTSIPYLGAQAAVSPN